MSAATSTAGPVQRRSRRAHAIEGLAGSSGRAILLRSAAMAGDTSLRGKLVRSGILIDVRVTLDTVAVED